MSGITSTSLPINTATHFIDYLATLARFRVGGKRYILGDVFRFLGNYLF